MTCKFPTLDLFEHNSNLHFIIRTICDRWVACFTVMHTQVFVSGGEWNPNSINALDTGNRSNISSISEMNGFYTQSHFNHVRFGYRLLCLFIKCLAAGDDARIIRHRNSRSVSRIRVNSEPAMRYAWMCARNRYKQIQAEAKQKQSFCNETFRQSPRHLKVRRHIGWVRKINLIFVVDSVSSQLNSNGIRNRFNIRFIFVNWTFPRRTKFPIVHWWP